MNIPPEAAQHLGWYVYLYVDPRTSRVFYVGKGKGGRVFAHQGAVGETRKARIMRELRDAGLEPQLEILAHALPNEEIAYRIEGAAIDLVGFDDLANEVRGHGCELGRMPLRELLVYYTAKPVEVVDTALLIRVSQVYRHGMDPHALYEATRGIWEIGERRLGARLALAVYRGVVREGFRIHSWHPAGTTPYSTRDANALRTQGRWEFLGTLAEPERQRYVDRSVAAYFKRGQQSPVSYVGC